MFWKKPRFQDPRLGVLTYANGVWVSEPLRCTVGEVLVSVDGDRSSPNAAALGHARELIADPTMVVDLAKAFIAADANAQELMRENGELVLDGFTLTDTPGTFTVDFGLSNWPDAVLNVKFAHAIPVEVELGD